MQGWTRVVDGEVLREHLARMKDAVESNKSLVPGHRLLTVTPGENAIGFDGAGTVLSWSSSAPATGGGAGDRVQVGGHDLADRVAALPEGPVTITASSVNGGRLSLKSKARTFSLVIVPDQGSPEPFAEDETTEVTLAPIALAVALEAVEDAQGGGGDEEKFAATHLRSTPKGLIVEAMNGKQSARDVVLAEDLPPIDLLLPRRAALALRNFLATARGDKETAMLTIGKARLSATIGEGGRVFGSKLLVGSFPPYMDKLFGLKTDAVVTINRKILLDAMRALQVVAADKKFYLYPVEGGLSIAGDTVEQNGTEDLEAVVEGDFEPVVLDSTFFLAAVASFWTPSVRLLQTKSKGKVDMVHVRNLGTQQAETHWLVAPLGQTGVR